MILALTLNPSIIKTSIVDGFEINAVNNIIDERIDFNDGPLHSVNTIKLLQGEPFLLGFMGGPNGRYIKSFLEKNKIKSDLTWLDEEITSIHRIIDSIQGIETILRDKSINIHEKALKTFFQKLQLHINEVSLLILSGDLPQGINDEDLHRILSIAKTKQKRIIFSLKTPLFRKLLTQQPFGILLDEYMMKDLGLKYDDEEIMLDQCYDLLQEYKLKYVVIYYNNKGVYTITKNKICYAYYKKELEFYEKNGIIDAIIGAFSISIEREYEQEKISKLLYAVALASRLTQYPNLVKRKDIDYLKKRVKVKELRSRSKGMKLIKK